MNTGTTTVGIMDGSGNLLKPGERGEVVIRGANVVTGYENNPEANASSFTNGLIVPLFWLVAVMADVGGKATCLRGAPVSRASLTGLALWSLLAV